MPEDAKEQPTGSKFNVKDEGDCRYSVKVHVPAETVKERFKEKMEAVLKDVQLPGFRKGHVPPALVEKRFGKALREDVKGALVEQSFTEALEEHKLDPIASPALKLEEISFDETKPLEYEVSFEVAPKLKLENYTGIEVTKPAAEVTPEDIKTGLQRLRDSRAELIVVTDGKIENEDYIIADHAIKVDGKVVYRNENVPMLIGPDLMLFDKPSPDLHKALLGGKIGDERSVQVTLPDFFDKADYRGKEADFNVMVKEVKRKKLPEVNEEFAKLLDFGSIAELEDAVKKTMQHEKEGQAAQAVEQQIIDHLLKTEFPVPQGLIDSETASVMAKMRMELYEHGVPAGRVDQELDKYRQQSREAVVKNIRTTFVLQHIAEREKIFATEDDVEERIGQIAASSKRWPQEVRDYLEKNGLLAQLRVQLREEKAKAFLRSKAVVKGA
jgi:trigger factor